VVTLLYTEPLQRIDSPAEGGQTTIGMEERLDADQAGASPCRRRPWPPKIDI
jgi:hypothetical protein